MTALRKAFYALLTIDFFRHILEAIKHSAIFHDVNYYIRRTSLTKYLLGNFF